MRHPLRALALALALAATPACTTLPFGQAPIAAARAPDQQAYALLHTYAAVLEEAADIVRDPATPVSVRRALGQAEAAATPAIEALHAVLSAYRAGGRETALNDAIASAQAPVAQFEALVRANH